MRNRHPQKYWHVFCTTYDQAGGRRAICLDADMPASCSQAVGRLLQFPSDARLATPEGNVGSGAEGPQAMEMDMSLTGSAQVCAQYHIRLSLLVFVWVWVL